MYGALNDPYFVILVLSCAAVVTIGAIVTALGRMPRAEVARLQNELKELAGRVKALEAAEQRRFVRELNTRDEGPEAKSTTNGGGLVEATAESLAT
jgi:hypothetical protein